MKNIYSDLVNSDYFARYKESNDVEKEKIADEIFGIIRGVNKFPYPYIEDWEIVKNLRTLASSCAGDNYNNGTIPISTTGSILCQMFYPNIFDVIKNRRGTRPISIKESFFLDKDLRRIVKATLEYDNNIDGIVAWFRQSDVGYTTNFRPASAKIIYDTNLSEGSRVLDYAAGYGGRLLGAWAADSVSEYVGIEPNTETYLNGLKFIAFLDSEFNNLQKATLYQECSEDFTIEKYPTYKGYFDMAFSSPPYFNLEVYSNEETQSYNKFNDYERWVKGYLKPTIHNVIDMLKPEGIFAVNIYEDITDHCKAPNIRKIIQLLCRENGYIPYKTDFMKLTRRAGNGDRDRSEEKSEPIWYFKRVE